MDYIEEKTPGGITLKVMIKKWNFIAFERDGKVIYADEAEAKVLHKIPGIVLISDSYQIVRKDDSELAFFKVNKGKIIIPYVSIQTNIRKYLFIGSDSNIDLIPLRIKEIKDLSSLIRTKDSTLVPDYVVIDEKITDEDCIIIKNRFPNTMIIELRNETGKGKEDIIDSGLGKGSEEVQGEKNLNIMSNNPVFLARIHLRDMALSKVNQLLLDFDISSLEADYMLKFIENMLENPDNKAEIEQNRLKLLMLKDSFQFYIYLMDKNEKEIQNMINSVEDIKKIASYSTLIAKMRTLFTAKKDLLTLTDYENLIYEKKDQLQKK
ncbi:MAG: hypothetical protein MUC95_03660 [Spirochaetes bacterium]|nr:hypothetical protein [Spirochaetota bacterium]